MPRDARANAFEQATKPFRWVADRNVCSAIIYLVGAMLVFGCGLGSGPARAATRLQGAGATFPAPFYKRLVVVYQGIYPDVLIDYQSFGSGGGIRAITAKTVHFCGSDAPMSKKELEAVGGGEEIVEIPSCAGEWCQRTTCPVFRAGSSSPANCWPTFIWAR